MFGDKVLFSYLLLEKELILDVLKKKKIDKLLRKRSKLSNTEQMVKQS